MTKQLYEEALADVKKLKEVAEDNAKRALLEAVTPRIRDLIETQLMGDMPLDSDDDEELLMDVIPGSEEGEAVPPLPVATIPQPPVQVEPVVTPVPEAGASAAAAAAISTPDEEGKVTLDLDSLKVPDTDEYELSVESAITLGMMLKGNTFEDKLRYLNKQVESVAHAGKLVRESKGFVSTLSSIISDVKDTYSYLQKNMHDSQNREMYEEVLEKQFSTLNELMEQKMKNGKKTLTEADVTLKLTGMPDDLDLDSVGVDLISGDEEGGEEGDEGGDLDLDMGDEGGDEGDDGELDLDMGDDDEEEQLESKSLGNNTVVEIDEGMLRREISRMKSLKEEKPPSIKGNGPGKVADGWEEDDLGDPFVDGEVTTEALDELDDGVLEMDMGEASDPDGEEDPSSDKQSRAPGATVESLRRRLAHEARLQMEAKKKASKAAKGKKDAQKKGAQSKKMQEKQACRKQAKKMQEAYVYFATKFNESVARSNKLRGMLSEAARKGRTLNSAPAKPADGSNLRDKLAETNLFNAKLLFTNKLLQNESLTKRQKASVIEKLDEAKSQREAKLVYESAVNTVQDSSNKRITESAEKSVIGSSSRPARSSGASLNEGFESTRWAKLAGILK